MTSDVNVNYGGKIQVEKLLEGVEDPDQKQGLQSTLLSIAEEIVQDAAEALESDDNGFPQQ